MTSTPSTRVSDCSREARAMDPQQRLFSKSRRGPKHYAGRRPDRSTGHRYVGTCSSDSPIYAPETLNLALDAHFTSGIAHSIVSWDGCRCSVCKAPA